METLKEIEECFKGLKDVLVEKDTEVLTPFGEIVFIFFGLSLFIGLLGNSNKNKERKEKKENENTIN